ncbi:hypothetical protein ACTQ6A_09530 [Lachnospiraceae bacterium LCP25S3_G4]
MRIAIISNKQGRFSIGKERPFFIQRVKLLPLNIKVKNWNVGQE